MPVLENARHERFSQEIAKGESSRDAYRTAGYETKSDAAADASASRLLSSAKVAERVAELQSRGAARAELTVEKILDELEEARLLAKLLEQPSAMVAASMGRAKVSGRIVDRKEVGKPGDFDDWSVEDLQKYILDGAVSEGLVESPKRSRGATKH